MLYFSLKEYLLKIHLQKEQKMELKMGLASLPAPRNDFEIVIPENENGIQEEPEVDPHFVEDAADVEAKRLQMLAEKSK